VDEYDGFGLDDGEDEPDLDDVDRRQAEYEFGGPDDDEIDAW
jgi:hypothetical protein